MPAEPSSPAATYVAAAIPIHSIDHFVLLMTATESRPIVATSIALTRVIENIPRQGNEPQIVQLKLHWWLEEIEMIAQKKPRHPLSIELNEMLDHEKWLEPLHTLVTNTLNEITRPVFASMADVLSHCHHASERQALIASVLPQCDGLAMDNARNNGVAICITELLSDRHNGRLPAEGMEGQTAAKTFGQLASLADEHFNAAGPLPTTQRQVQSALLIQARLYRRLLHRLRRCNYDPSRAAMRPLTLLWHAWREARNLMK